MQTKQTNQKIVDSAISVLKSGNDLSARNLAKQLGCSTQPIYSSFQNMQVLEDEVKKQINLMLQKTFEAQKGKYPHYQALGLSFVKFAREEPRLFAYLYLGDGSGDTFSVDYLNLATDEMAKEFNISKELAYKFHLDMLVYCYGLAVMQFLGQNASDKVVLNRLKFQFEALCKMYDLKIN